MPWLSAKIWTSTCRRPLDQSLHIQRTVTERRDGLTPGGADRFEGIAVLGDDPHALAAATRRGLDQHGIAQAPGGREHALVGLIAWRIAGHDRHAGAPA